MKEAGILFIKKANSKPKCPGTKKLSMNWRVKFVKIYIFRGSSNSMKYRAMIKKTGGWWIGWLIDLPGVNAQEKTRAKLIESLKIGAEEMLLTEVPFEPNAQMTTIDIREPEWAAS